MEKNLIKFLLIIGIIITVAGLITGKFFFLLLIIPLGFGFLKSRKN